MKVLIQHTRERGLKRIAPLSNRIGNKSDEMHLAESASSSLTSSSLTLNYICYSRADAK
jgi:hypothetical protein